MRRERSFSFNQTASWINPKQDVMGNSVVVGHRTSTNSPQKKENSNNKGKGNINSKLGNLIKIYAFD